MPKTLVKIGSQYIHSTFIRRLVGQQGKVAYFKHESLMVDFSKIDQIKWLHFMGSVRPKYKQGDPEGHSLCWSYELEFSLFVNC